LTEQLTQNGKIYPLFIFGTQVFIFSSDVVIQLHELNSLDKWYISLWQYMKDSLFLPFVICTMRLVI